MIQTKLGPTLEDLRAWREEIARIADVHGAHNVRVFGSMACGEASVASDVDLLVDVVADAFGSFLSALRPTQA